MGKQNNQKQNNQPQKRYKGKNVHPLSGPVQMGQHATRLIKNLAFGNFNMETDGAYFQNQEFLMAAIHEVGERVKKEEIYNVALNYTYGNTNDITVLKMINEHKRALDAWNFVYSTLSMMVSTGDMSLLLTLMNRLPDYKYLM